MEMEQGQEVKVPVREEDWVVVAAEWEEIVPEQVRQEDVFVQSAAQKHRIRPESRAISRVARSAGQKWSENRSFFAVRSD